MFEYLVLCWLKHALFLELVVPLALARVVRLVARKRRLVGMDVAVLGGLLLLVSSGLVGAGKRRLSDSALVDCKGLRSILGVFGALCVVLGSVRGALVI